MNLWVSSTGLRFSVSALGTWPLTPAAAVRYGYDYYPMIFRPSISYYLPSYLDLPHITEYTWREAYKRENNYAITVRLENCNVTATGNSLF